MRNKNSSVKIKHLHHVFASPLIAYDVLHYEMTGEENVITSANDDKHWGSIKKEDRPDGWENFTEEQVREHSNSKHYLNEAIDCRKIHYDKLSEVNKAFFLKSARKIFKNKLFDFVVEFNHFHIEYDPKPIRQRIMAGFKKREPRQWEPEFKDPEPIKPTKLNPGEIEIPWYHFYKRNGFKRVTGFAVGLGGLVLKLIPDTAILGEIVMYAGGSLGVIGVGDALKKNREKDSDTYVDKIKYLRIIADIIIRLLKQFLKKKGK